MIDNDGGGSKAVNRSMFRTVQTPQLFKAEKLIDANRRLLPEGEDEMNKTSVFTDDASVMETAGYTTLILTEGDPRNIKVTNTGDMEIADLYLAESDL